MLTEIANTWYIVVSAAALYGLVASLGTWRLDASFKPLNGTFKSYDQLESVKGSINLNMTLAILLLVYAGMYLFFLMAMVGIGTLSFFTATIYMATFSLAGFLCAKLWFLKVEKRAKATQVVSEDPRVRQTWERWLKEWKELRLRLSD
jgi:hypothetical protein